MMSPSYDLFRLGHTSSMIKTAHRMIPTSYPLFSRMCLVLLDKDQVKLVGETFYPLFIYKIPLVFVINHDYLRP